MNKWKTIWNNRTIVSLNSNESFHETVLQQKQINGYDVVGDGLTYDAIQKQLYMLEEKLSFSGTSRISLNSVFEVGCGSGPNLLYFSNKKIEVGGMDYSNAMITMAKGVILKYRELYNDDAINIDTKIKYDAVFANAVFSYFDSYEYARKVLDRMLEKTNFSIGILDVHDESKKEAFLSNRRKMIKDYDERYKDLDKLFFSKEFFTKYADEHNLNIEFSESNVEGYWNNDYVFDSFMYKR